MATPNFEFDKVYNQLLEQGGRNRAVYINGMFTTLKTFKDVEQQKIIEVLNLNFSGNANENSFDRNNQEVFVPEIIQIPSLNNLNGSIFLDPHYNKSDTTGNLLLDATLSIVKGVGVGLLAFGISDLLGKKLNVDDLKKVNFADPVQVEYFLKTNLGIDVITGAFTQLYNDAISLIQGLFNGTINESLQALGDKLKNNEFLGKMFQDIGSILESVVKGGNPFAKPEFLDKLTGLVLSVTSWFVPAVAVVDAVYQGVMAGLPEDVKEAFSQFWFADTDISQKLNKEWTNDAASWLTGNNSLILMGYSQGNFFLEDALKNMGSSADPAKTRILAFGSPTNYFSVGGIESYNGNDKYNIRNNGDPVTKLQSPDDSWINKIKSLFDAGKTAVQQLGFGQHDFSKYIYEGSIADSGFKDLVYELHPNGFYFPKGTVSTGSTTDDDWVQGDGDIQGGLRNDVLQGKNGNDTLSGDSGFDFLDGGTGGTDTASYSGSPIGIKVWADKVAGC